MNSLVYNLSILHTVCIVSLEGDLRRMDHIVEEGNHSEEEMRKRRKKSRKRGIKE